MAWKFLNIGKANAEIERLEKELAAEQGKVATLTKERDDAKAALEANDSEIAKNAESVQKELTTAKADLTAAQGQVTAITKERDDAKAQLATVTKERDEAKAKLADPKGPIQTAAAVKAAEITAGQGQATPIAVSPVATPAAKVEAPKLKGLAKVQAAIKAQLTGEPATK